MSIEGEIKNRSGNTCELCSSSENLSAYEVPPLTIKGSEGSILACSTCLGQIEGTSKMNPNHWRCLNDSMWSEVAAVQVVVWRMLNRIKFEGWPQDLLDMLYLDEETKRWAEATGEGEDAGDKIIHKDCNGVRLHSGDAVVIIKDLNVKGSSLVAKRGVVVRNISLVHDNPNQIEGKVEGQHIVILTEFVKKT